MSDPQPIGEAIEEFLAKYPDNVRMEWRGRGPNHPQDTTMTALTTAGLFMDAARTYRTAQETTR